MILIKIAYLHLDRCFVSDALLWGQRRMVIILIGNVAPVYLKMFTDLLSKTQLFYLLLREVNTYRT
jgi:hypothetical protein